MKTLSLLLFCSVLACDAAQEPAARRLVQTIPLPGVKGRFDHFSQDLANGRLMVAALGNDTVEVLDVAGGRHVRSIGGLQKPQGVLFLPGLNRLVVACGGDGAVRLFEGTTFAPLKSLGSLDDADNLRFDPEARLVYVGYGEGSLGVIDPAAARLVGDIRLAGHPEAFQLERLGKRLFVNVVDQRNATGKRDTD